MYCRRVLASFSAVNNRTELSISGENKKEVMNRQWMRQCCLTTKKICEIKDCLGKGKGSIRGLRCSDN